MIAAGGCAGTEVPTQAELEAVSAIRAAQAVGAEQEPKAALHLSLAQEQMAAAQEHIGAGEPREAELLLYQAEADAALAQALTRESRTRAEADATRHRIDQMQERFLEGENR